MTEIILNNLNNNLFDILLHSRSRTTDNIAIKCVQTQTGRTIAVAKWDTSFKGKTAEPALH